MEMLQFLPSYVFNAKRKKKKLLVNQSGKVFWPWQGQELFYYSSLSCTYFILLLLSVIISHWHNKAYKSQDFYINVYFPHIFLPPDNSALGRGWTMWPQQLYYSQKTHGCAHLTWVIPSEREITYHEAVE